MELEIGDISNDTWGGIFSSSFVNGDRSWIVLCACNQEGNRNAIDLARDVTEAYVNARSGDWVEAASKSLDVGRDVVDIGTQIGETFVESRADAVRDGYAENSDIGFQ